jgi:hypothetical protein
MRLRELRRFERVEDFWRTVRTLRYYRRMGRFARGLARVGCQDYAATLRNIRNDYEGLPIGRESRLRAERYKQLGWI